MLTPLSRSYDDRNVGTLLIVGLLTLIAAGVLYQLVGARRGARRHPAPGTMVPVGGHRLHVVCAGAGSPAVLFESGIAASSLSWVRVIDEVAAFTRVCAYDRTGLGWSDPSRGPRTAGRMIDELHRVLAHACHAEAPTARRRTAPAGPRVLAGHSFGAFLVCAFASAYPNEVAGLVLIDPPSDWHTIEPRQARMLRGGIHLSRLGGLLARVGVVRACLALLTGGAPGVPRNFVRIFGPTAARTLERLVGEVRKLPPEIHPVVQTLWCQPKCFRAMADHLAALEELAAMVAGVSRLPEVPLVVISSGDQPDETLERHRQLTRRSSQGRHVVAARSGHWVQFDEPDVVVAAIREVVDAVRR
jgi:pimeloyl-ACP methyl ester carboxylesterase